MGKRSDDESSTSSTSSTSTIVDVRPVKMKSVVSTSEEVGTQTIKTRPTRSRTRRQRREAKLRRAQAEDNRPQKGSQRDRSRERRLQSHRRRPTSYSRRDHSREEYMYTESRSTQRDNSRDRCRRSTNTQRVQSRDSRSYSRPSSVNEGLQVSVSHHGRSVEARGKQDSRDSRASVCPIPGCTVSTKKLKRHAYEWHLPDVVRDATSPCADMDEEFQRLRGRAKLTLAKWICKSDTATVFDLVQYVNKNNVVPETAVILQRQISQYTYLSYAMEWRQPRQFTLHPVNSPALMLHWRVMVALVCKLLPEQREEFQRIGISYVAPPVETFLEECDKTVAAEAAVKPGIIDIYDSHFHLDRLQAKLGDKGKVRQLVAARIKPAPEQPVNLRGGLMVLCDPLTYHKINRDLDVDFPSAVGFHPRHAFDFNDHIKQEINQYLKSEHVVALCEIGIDRTEPKGTWRQQEVVLKAILSMATPEKPLVLHVRGPDGDTGASDTYSRCLAILRECVRNIDQPIHLHCFGGFRDQVRQWRSDFPNTFFGFSGMVRHFSDEQVEGLREFPLHRLLVETDSPYLPVNPEVCPNTPLYIGDVAALISGIRELALKDLVSATNRNYRKLYL